MRQPVATEKAMSEDLPLPSNVSDEGVASFLQGVRRDDCPYPPGSDDRESWLEGWDKAEREDSGKSYRAPV
jgi:ribosome modulation factor